MDLSKINCRRSPSFSLKEDTFLRFMTTLPRDASFVALSGAYAPDRRLTNLAFLHADQQAVTINLAHDATDPEAHQRFQAMLQSTMECIAQKTARGLIAYDAEVLASALFLDWGVRLPPCFNLEVNYSPRALGNYSFTRKLFETPKAPFTPSLYEALFDYGDPAQMISRAWGALTAAYEYAKRVNRYKPVNTMALPVQVSRLVVDDLLWLTKAVYRVFD